MSTSAFTAAPVDNPAPKSAARWLTATGRILLGLPLCVFGLNGFLEFIPPPPEPLPEGAMNFLTALAETGYMLPLIAVMMIVCGVLLLVNRFVPLALVVLAPFFVNSIIFHARLEPSGFPVACVFVALELALAWSYRRAFAPLLTARHQPNAPVAHTS